MASYTLLATETTVQVLSPTVTMDVVYATLQTQPSGVICSIALAKIDFDAGTSGPLLTSYANDVEELVNYQHVIGGQGTQTIDANGLIQDQVSFVVEYVPPKGSGTSITAEAIVPNGLLGEGGDPAFENILIGEAKAIIDGVYANLVSAAGG